MISSSSSLSGNPPNTRVVAVLVDGINFCTTRSFSHFEFDHLIHQIETFLRFQLLQQHQSTNNFRIVFPDNALHVFFPDPQDSFEKGIINHPEKLARRELEEKLKTGSPYRWSVINSIYKSQDGKWKAAEEDVKFTNCHHQVTYPNALGRIGCSTVGSTATDVFLVTSDGDHVPTLELTLGSVVRWAVLVKKCKRISDWGQRTLRCLELWKYNDVEFERIFGSKSSNGAKSYSNNSNTPLVIPSPSSSLLLNDKSSSFSANNNKTPQNDVVSSSSSSNFPDNKAILAAEKAKRKKEKKEKKEEEKRIAASKSSSIAAIIDDNSDDQDDHDHDEDISGANIKRRSSKQTTTNGFSCYYEDDDGDDDENNNNNSNYNSDNEEEYEEEYDDDNNKNEINSNSNRDGDICCLNYAMTGRCSFADTKMKGAGGATCPLEHHRKEELCREYLTSRTCRFGERCIFVHKFGIESSSSSFSQKNNNKKNKTRNSINDDDDYDLYKRRNTTITSSASSSTTTSPFNHLVSPVSPFGVNNGTTSAMMVNSSSSLSLLEKEKENRKRHRQEEKERKKLEKQLSSSRNQNGDRQNVKKSFVSLVADQNAVNKKAVKETTTPFAILSRPPLPVVPAATTTTTQESHQFDRKKEKKDKKKAKNDSSLKNKINITNDKRQQRHHRDNNSISSLRQKLLHESDEDATSSGSEDDNDDNDESATPSAMTSSTTRTDSSNETSNSATPSYSLQQSSAPISPHKNISNIDRQNLGAKNDEKNQQQTRTMKTPIMTSNPLFEDDEDDDGSEDEVVVGINDMNTNNHNQCHRQVPEGAFDWNKNTKTTSTTKTSSSSFTAADISSMSEMLLCSENEANELLRKFNGNIADACNYYIDLQQQREQQKQEQQSLRQKLETAKNNNKKPQKNTTTFSEIVSNNKSNNTVTTSFGSSSATSAFKNNNNNNSHTTKTTTTTTTQVPVFTNTNSVIKINESDVGVLVDMLCCSKHEARELLVKCRGDVAAASEMFLLEE